MLLLSLIFVSPSTSEPMWDREYPKGAENARVEVMCWWSAEVANRYNVIGRGAQCSRGVRSVIEWVYSVTWVNSPNGAHVGYRLRYSLSHTGSEAEGETKINEAVT
ncbi:uncharacterized protein G2W53_039649 [Senna tora]|uniref:Uncharacterized protein n=1 Tax=Senna tora TaxID=362788 RepID=A0A834SMZ9_9FABA|nr:uncharacterized protein G2W53_039649 [Senna tora]